ncbi:glycosyltransferase, partial [Candidatus Dojkabacteria bacterium]|nr:glycosyltransferase [Candidatus Dojkabacteria bacterium]
MKTTIIIPVFYGPEQALRAISAAESTTNRASTEIIVIDDTGNKSFNDFFKKMLSSLGLIEKITLKINQENQGYLKACKNEIIGLSSEYAVILHQDTLVTGDWLTNMIKTAESDSKIALVNPSTNYAPILNIDIPKGSSINQISKFLNDYDYKDKFIDIVTATDFCLLLKNQYIKEYGFFDESYEKGYGAVADLHFRYITQGLRAVISPSSFVYHKGSGIEDEQDEIYKQNRVKLMDRYKDVHDGSIEEFTNKTVLNDIREQLSNTKDRDIDVLFISPSNNITGGGVKIMHNMCNSLNEVGINSTIASTWVDTFKYRQDRLYKEIEYKELYNLNIKPKVIAYSLDHNAYEVIKYVRHIEKQYKYTPKILYIAQDVEGWFEYHDTESFITYAALGDQILTVSPFVQGFLQDKLPNKKIDMILNSISSNFYGDYLQIINKTQSSDELFTITAMMRDDTKRGAKIISEAITNVSKKLNRKVKFIGFGGDISIPSGLPNIIYEKYERIPEDRVKELLAKSNLFIEASFFQGFGLVAIEALFSNNIVLSSKNAGAAGVLPKVDNIDFFTIADSNELEEKILEIVNQNNRKDD